MKMIRTIIFLILMVVGPAATRADWTAAHTAADEGDVTALTKLLENQPALVDAREAGDHTPLHLAVWSGRRQAAALLLQKGADVNAPDVCGWTPLHTAANRNEKAIAELLLSKGANINEPDRRGQTPLRLAEKYGNRELANFLRARGASE